MDNVVNNDVIVQLVQQRAHLGYEGKFFHIRCVCHIINLTVQVDLKLIQ